MREVRDLVTKAHRFLDSARRLLEAGDHDSCVSRCYYAMFLVAEAALLTRGATASTHKGVIAAFGRLFVRPGTVPRELGRWLSTAHDLRLVADYAAGLTVAREDAERTLAHARRFVETVRACIEHSGPERDDD